jgi:predicted GNAT family acetyltransferase
VLLSLYAEYLKERTKDLIIETEDGFATYRYLDHGQVYIIDIYVVPEKRQKGAASKMADAVVKEAKLKGRTALIGTVVPSTNHSTISLNVLLAYGMTLASSSNDCIIFKKEI